MRRGLLIAAPASAFLACATPASGPYPAAGHTAAGTYTVTVTVVAKDGQRASASIKVTVTA